jgi:hypothetical protein
MKSTIESVDFSSIADPNAYDEHFWNRVNERSRILCDRLEKEENSLKSTREQYTKEFNV